MFEAIAQVVTRRWAGALVLLAWAGIAGALLRFAPPWDAVSKDDDVRFFPAGSVSVIGQELMERGFPNSTPSAAVVICERPGGPLSAEDRAFVGKLADRLKGLVRKPPLPDGEPDWKIRQVDDFRTPGIGERLIGGSGKDGQGQAALTVVGIDAFFQSKQARLTVNEIEEAIEKSRPDVPDGLVLGLTGSAVVGHDTNEASNASISATTYATITLVVFILLLVYRSPVLALIPLVTITLSVIIALRGLPALSWIPGLNFQVIGVTKVFVIVVLFGAGTDYCLFLIARYREELARGQGVNTALRTSIRQVGGALVASAGTVIVGLGMLWFSTFAKIQYSGPAIALSLAIALVAALTMAPVLLRLLKGLAFWPLKPPHHHLGADPEVEGQAETPMHGVWTWIANVVTRRPGLILAASLVFVLPFAYWGTQTRTNYGQFQDLPPDAPSRTGAAVIRQYFTVGELGPINLLLRAPGLDLRSPEGRELVESLSKELASRPEVAEVRSLTRPLGKPLAEPAGKAPTGGLGSLIGNLARGDLSAARNQALRLGAENFYVSTGATDPNDLNHITRLTLVLKLDPFSVEAVEALEKLRDELAARTTSAQGPLSGGDVGFSGATAEIRDLKSVITVDERRMYILVTLGVYAILVLLLRRPGISLYLIATVVVGYLFTLGVTDLVYRALHQGPDLWYGLDWKVSFFLFVILVAIGEDYNIFLMSRVIEEEDEHGVEEGTRRAVAHTGGIISSCGLIMAGTFAAMLTGKLLALRQLGFALCLGVLLDTFIVRPILVPCFIILLARLRARLRGEKPRPPKPAAPSTNGQPEYPPLPFKVDYGVPVGSRRR